MIDRAMLLEVFAKRLVYLGFIGHQVSFGRDLSLENRTQRFSIDVSNLERAFLAVTLDKGNNFHLMRPPARILGLLALVTPIGFVCFNSRTIPTKQAAVSLGHSLTNAMTHEPCGFVADFDHAANIEGAHTFFLADMR